MGEASLDTVPYRDKLVDGRGLVTPEWGRWFELLLVRTGGQGTTDPGPGADFALTLSPVQVRATEPTVSEPTGFLRGLPGTVDDLRTLATVPLWKGPPSVPTRVQDFMLEVAKGLIPGHAGVNRDGRAPQCPQNLVSDIWDRANTTDGQRIWAAPTAARVHRLRSTDANDTAAGTGARTVEVIGLTSWNTSHVSETVTMSGLTNVPTVNSYVIIDEMRVLTKGNSGEPNLGTITATADVDLSVTAQIQPFFGRTLMAIVGVPSVQDAYLTHFYASQAAVPTGQYSVISLLVNTEPETELTGFVNVGTQAMAINGQSRIDQRYAPYVRLPGPAIIKLSVVPDANDQDIAGGFDLIYVDK